MPTSRSRNRFAFCLSLLLGLMVSTIAYAQKMYFTTSAGIFRANLDGTDLECLVPDVRPGDSRFLGIALDVDNGKMYWTAYNLGKLQRANLDGSGIEDLPFTCAGPRDIALDASSGTLFWTESERVHLARLSTMQSEQLLDVYCLDGIAVDPAASRLYWTSGSLQRARLDGTEKEELVASHTNIVRGLALDLDAGLMYFLSHKCGDDAAGLHVQRARIPKDRVTSAVSQGEDLVITDNGRSGWGAGIALDPAGGRVYWTAEGWRPGSQYAPWYSCIQRAKLDGTAVEGLVYIRGEVRDIALDLRPTPSDSAGVGHEISSLRKAWPFLGAAGALVMLGLVMSWRLGVRRRRLTRQDLTSPDGRTLRATMGTKLNKAAKWCCLCAAVLVCASWGMSTLCRVWYRGWEDENILCERGILRYDCQKPRLPAYMRDRWIFYSDESTGWQMTAPSLTCWRQLVDQRSGTTLGMLLGLGFPRAASRAFGDSRNPQVYIMQEYIIPLWVPSLLFTTLTIVLFLRHRRRAGPGHCLICGYDLTGNVTGICPECGTPISEKAQKGLAKEAYPGTGP